MKRIEKFVSEVAFNAGSLIEKVVINGKKGYKFWCDGFDEDVMSKSSYQYEFTIINDWYDKSQGEESIYGGTERLEMYVWK